MGNNKKGNMKRKSTGVGDSSCQRKECAGASDIGRGRPGRKPKQLKPNSSTSNLESNGAGVDNGSQVEYHHNVREPKCTFDELKGIDTLKEKLRKRLIRRFVDPEEAADLKVRIPRGILLTGKPGTGKNSLADGIVHEIMQGREVRYYVQSGSIMDSYFGESEKRLRSLFKKAAETAPSVIFFDELDGLGVKRSESSANSCMNTIVTTFLTEMNDVQRGKVLIIAATNYPERCDPALIRKGRFDIKEELPLPDLGGRIEIMQHYLQKRGATVDSRELTKISRKMEKFDFSGCDLETIVDGSWENFLARVFINDSSGAMSRQERREKIQSESFSVEEDLIPHLEEMTNAKLSSGFAEVKTEPMDMEIIDLGDDGEVVKEPEVLDDASCMPMEDITACASGFLENISNENQHGVDPVYNAELANVEETPIEQDNQGENNGDLLQKIFSCLDWDDLKICFVLNKGMELAFYIPNIHSSDISKRARLFECLTKLTIPVHEGLVCAWKDLTNLEELRLIASKIGIEGNIWIDEIITGIHIGSAGRDSFFTDEEIKHYEKLYEAERSMEMLRKLRLLRLHAGLGFPSNLNITDLPFRIVFNKMESLECIDFCGAPVAHVGVSNEVLEETGKKINLLFGDKQYCLGETGM